MKRWDQLTVADKQGVRIIVAVLAFVLLIAGVIVYQRINRAVFDSENCQISDKQSQRRLPVAQTAILLDQSEALTPTQRAFAERFLRELIGDLKRGEKLSFYTFNKDEYQALEPVISLCKPQASANPIFENERKVIEHLQQRFVSPISNALSVQLYQTFGIESPILEALRAVSRSKEIGQWPMPKRLVIISDLLQHKPPYTHYRPPVNYLDWKKRYGQDLAANFEGWEISVVYLTRFKDRQYQRPEHLEFWQRYFTDSGAQIKQIEAVD